MEIRYICKSDISTDKLAFRCFSFDQYLIEQLLCANDSNHPWDGEKKGIE